FQPAILCRFDLGAVAGDTLGQLGKAAWIAGVEVGVGKRSFVGGDFGHKTIDLTRQAIVIALVLVRELVPRRRPGSSFPFLWRLARLGPGLRRGTMRLVSLPHPILVAAGDNIDPARAVEPERDRHGPVEKVAV